MKSAIHCYYIQNGRPVDRRYYLVSLSESVLEIYEVLRLIEGVPLFLEDHYLRLKRSARLIGKTLGWTLPQVEQNIRQLVEANRVVFGNIKLLVQWEEESQADLYTCFIPHRYPTAKEQHEGVTAATMRAERRNPNVKITELEIRTAADRRIVEKKVYEVLLVNENQQITEGSRSNFFAVREERLITPPLADVLPGITRQKVLDIAASLGIGVEEKRIGRDELATLEAAFLTGTSPGVLPLREIDGHPYPAGQRLVREIARTYDARVQAYIHSHNSVLLC